MNNVKLVFHKSTKVLFTQLKLCFEIYLLVLLMSGNSFAQDQGNSKDPDNNQEPEYVNFGYVSVSPTFVVDPRAKSITFKIRNNATRSIQSIFGWVYEIKTEEKGATSQFRLVNNPNKGGILLKGRAHEPSAEKQWRFPLVAANPPLDPSKQFTILIDPRGVRFSNFEKN
jgi:hypothetical protein